MQTRGLATDTYFIYHHHHHQYQYVGTLLNEPVPCQALVSLIFLLPLSSSQVRYHRNRNPYRHQSSIPSQAFGDPLRATCERDQERLISGKAALARHVAEGITERVVCIPFATYFIYTLTRGMRIACKDHYSDWLFTILDIVNALSVDFRLPVYIPASAPSYRVASTISHIHTITM